MAVASKTSLESLSDPSPPVPGAAERAAVGARADQLARRRRLLQGTGALACTAILGVGVVALVSASGSGSGTNRVETASAPEPGTKVTNPDPVVAAAPAPEAPSAPAPAEAPAVAPVDETPAPVAGPEVESAPAAAPAPAPEPVLASVRVTASSVPPGVTLDVTLVGSGGTFATSTTNGVVSFDGIPPGDYEARWSWQSDDGAAAAGRFNVSFGEGLNSFTF
jgi:hypothetical protein